MENVNLRSVTVFPHGITEFKGYFHGFTEETGLTEDGRSYVYKTAMIERADNHKIVFIDPRALKFDEQPWV